MAREDKPMIKIPKEISGLLPSQLTAALKMFDKAAEALGLKNLFNSGFTSDMKERAKFLLDNQPESYSDFPPKKDTWFDFFINFVDDFNSDYPGTQLTNGYWMKIRFDYIYACFSPTQWNKVIDKLKQTQYADKWFNVELFYYDKLMMSWIKENTPHAYDQALQMYNETKENGSTPVYSDGKAKINYASTFANIGWSLLFLLPAAITLFWDKLKKKFR